MDKRKAGLSVRQLHSLNKALLCKWSWCFAIQRNAFWREVIGGKHGELEGGWCSKKVKGKLWSAIMEC